MRLWPSWATDGGWWKERATIDVPSLTYRSFGNLSTRVHRTRAVQSLALAATLILTWPAQRNEVTKDRERQRISNSAITLCLHGTCPPPPPTHTPPLSGHTSLSRHTPQTFNMHTTILALLHDQTSNVLCCGWCQLHPPIHQTLTVTTVPARPE
jgi:hypothetical protein